jgi:uncharacterized membrane protein
MSDLIAVGYPNRETAEIVRLGLAEMTTSHVIEIADAVVVSRCADGQVKLHQTTNLTVNSAPVGAFWGGLIGLLSFAPLVGMAISGAAGALTDTGVNNSFMEALGGSLSPDGAALIVLVRKVAPEKVLPYVQEHAGRVIQTSEAQLRAALRPAPPVTPVGGEAVDALAA